MSYDLFSLRRWQSMKRTALILLVIVGLVLYKTIGPKLRAVLR